MGFLILPAYKMNCVFLITCVNYLRVKPGEQGTSFTIVKLLNITDQHYPMQVMIILR